MPSLMVSRKTLNPANEFHFECPIFKAEVRLADCLHLEEETKVGRYDEERGGCRVAIACGKCPIYYINQKLARDGEFELHASEKRVGRLPEFILDRIMPVMIQDKILNAVSMTDAERDLLNAAATGVKATGKVDEQVFKKPRKSSSPKASSTEEPASGVAQAAASGDISAAITRAVADTSSSPAPREAVATPPAAPKPTTPIPTTTEDGRPLTLLERARLARERSAAA